MFLGTKVFQLLEMMMKKEKQLEEQGHNREEYFEEKRK